MVYGCPQIIKNPLMEGPSLPTNEWSWKSVLHQSLKLHIERPNVRAMLIEAVSRCENDEGGQRFHQWKMDTLARLRDIAVTDDSFPRVTNAHGAVAYSTVIFQYDWVADARSENSSITPALNGAPSWCVALRIHLPCQSIQGR